VRVSPVDLFLSPDLSEPRAHELLEGFGFRDPRSADRNLRAIADHSAVRETLGRMAEPLLASLSRAPDPDAALVGLSRYLGARPDRVALLRHLADDRGELSLLVEILGTAPSLSETLIRHPDYFDWLASRIDRRPDPLQEARTDMDAALSGLGDTAVLDTLKQVQRRQLLGIVARDLLGRETLQEVTAQLAALADLVVDRTLYFISRERLRIEGRDRLPGAFAVIGMGKLGGQELNYSSDIDLIYVYEPDDEDASEPHAFFERLARKLTAALGEHTAESYLYRVDLRLRPMGRSGNIAHSLQQLRQYYETLGVTFERFSLLKARAIAGDENLGQRFLQQVEPFVYRQYLDHAALEEMYQYKKRIDRAIQRSERERNVKLGRGGIREVELFAQVLQLTYGGRNAELRQRNTLAALAALQRAGLIADRVRDELEHAYVFLRTVEHRLQIVQHDQTHTLSTNTDDLRICARRLQFERVEELEAALERHRGRVHDLYGGLFERRRETSDYRARQFFRILGDEVPVGEALKHLAECGFSDSAAALTAISALGRHASRASNPATARNILANLLDASVVHLARCARPEVVLTRLEQFAVRTGAAVPLARSLLDNEILRDVLIDVLDHGELAAQRLIRNPELLDSLGQPIPDIESLRRSFDESLDAMSELERTDRMDHLRRFKGREEFKILVGWLATESLEQLQERLSLLADACTSHTALWHAPSPPEYASASWAVVALGKLGGSELTVHSDLDLVFVYEDQDNPQDSELTWQNFVEATQAFLAKPTGEGVAYKIDTRLRPEGTKGPLAIPLSAFLRYLSERAEPWERLAYTRARVLAGSSGLSRQILTAVEEFVYGPWDPRLPKYMDHIRGRMERELAREPASKLDIKVGKGGLADIDFLLQLVQIREGRTRRGFRVPGSRRVLAVLPSTPYLNVQECEQLRNAHRFLRTIETLVRMDADSSVSVMPADAASLTPFGKRMGLSDPAGERLLARTREVSERVRAIYTRVMGRLDTPDNGRGSPIPRPARPVRPQRHG